ncbi:sn-glycerol-3-phosphate ABC transporter ATP-binding protein UgpC [Gaiella sp.]|uniref:ABC transporter ATP-binding protein n=1 Tax=Gaiella sp. TaxID=2663207 RepID=UPI003263FECC
MAAIEFRGVTKRFPDGTIAVDDLHLRIEDGEFMIFVGPSGCGKTTALRMVAGLEHPTSGEILIGGNVVNDLDPVDRDIAMVFQNYALYPHMTVRGNIGFPLETQRLPKAEREQRIAEAASLLGLEDLLERKPGALSGGQRQRVAMGRAIVRHPRSFLMDEPLSNLDAKLRVQMRAELVKLHQRLGVTTLYVTHDQVEAMTLGQRVAVLDHGVVQQVDPPDVLYNRPANMFVASFIGSPSMNFLRARIDGEWILFGEFRLHLPGTAAARLSRSDGELIVGLRPEYFSDAHLAGGNEAIPVTVEITEQLGSETLVYFRIDGVKAESSGDAQAELGGAFVARLDPRTRPVPGEQLQLTVDLERAHFFDPTGATLRIDGA